MDARRNVKPTPCTLYPEYRHRSIGLNAYLWGLSAARRWDVMAIIMRLNQLFVTGSHISVRRFLQGDRDSTLLQIIQLFIKLSAAANITVLKLSLSVLSHRAYRPIYFTRIIARYFCDSRASCVNEQTKQMIDRRWSGRRSGSGRACHPVQILSRCHYLLRRFNWQRPTQLL